MPYIDKRRILDYSIVDFLARLNYPRPRPAGGEYFYRSMLRDDDQGPSLSVHDAKGVWMDRGNADPEKRGGNIIKLAQLLYPDLSFYEVLQRIDDICQGRNVVLPLTYTPHRRETQITGEEKYLYELWDVRPIGTHPVINAYLDSRGLLEVAEDRLSEVYYRNQKYPEAGPYFAAGWENEHGNWEFSRADGLKSSTGKKGLTIIPGSDRKAQVFEGYFDYLSRLRYDLEPGEAPTVIVLNSVNLAGFALERLRDFSAVDIFCDHDGPGYRCTQVLKDALPQAVDRAYEYEGFNDYNQKLQADLGLLAHDRANHQERIGR